MPSILIEMKSLQLPLVAQRQTGQEGGEKHPRHHRIWAKDVVVVEVIAAGSGMQQLHGPVGPNALGNSPPLIVSNPALTNREQYGMWSRPKDVDGDTVSYVLETGPRE